MSIRVHVLLAVVLLPATLLIAKDKDKDKKNRVLPAYVLQARTVLVVVDPEVGAAVTDPNGNQIAQQDVETAITKWGRFTPVMSDQTADLVIAVRKGYGKAVMPTVNGGGVNNRPIILEPGNGGDVRIGGQRGRPPDLTDPGIGGGPGNGGVHPGMQVGSSEDMFEVYRGGVDYPLDSAPVWRYSAKNALRAPNVPAVAEFRKAIDEAEKQQKGKP